MRDGRVGARGRRSGRGRSATPSSSRESGTRRRRRRRRRRGRGRRRALATSLAALEGRRRKGSTRWRVSSSRSGSRSSRGGERVSETPSIGGGGDASAARERGGGRGPSRRILLACFTKRPSFVTVQAALQQQLDSSRRLLPQAGVLVYPYARTTHVYRNHGCYERDYGGPRARGGEADARLPRGSLGGARARASRQRLHRGWPRGFPWSEPEPRRRGVHLAQGRLPLRHLHGGEGCGVHCWPSRPARPTPRPPSVRRSVLRCVLRPNPRPTGTRRVPRPPRREWRPRPEARSDRASPCRRAVRTTARALPRVPAHIPARSRRTSTVEAPARASAHARVIAPEPKPLRPLQQLATSLPSRDHLSPAKPPRLVGCEHHDVLQGVQRENR